MDKVIIIFIILWGIATNPGLMETFIVTVAIIVLYIRASSQVLFDGFDISVFGSIVN